MFPFPWQSRAWMGATPNSPDQMLHSMWNSAASAALPHQGMVGQFCGSDTQLHQQAQPQAQTQAQISALQQQHALLNQQLASQAAPHIHQLQQLLPQQTPNLQQQAPTPQVPVQSEPPTPKVQPEVTPPMPPWWDAPEAACDRNYSQKVSNSTTSTCTYSGQSNQSATATTGTSRWSTTIQPSKIIQSSTSVTIPAPTEDHRRASKRPVVSVYRSPPRRRARSISISEKLPPLLSVSPTRLSAASCSVARSTFTQLRFPKGWSSPSILGGKILWLEDPIPWSVPV